MDKKEQIKRVLSQFTTPKENLCFTAKVTKINGNTCDVEISSGLNVSDVRLKTTSDELGDYLIIEPKLGSWVTVLSQSGDLTSLIVIKVDSVEKIIYKKGLFEFEINGTSQKVTLKNGTANFGILINNLIDTVSNAQIITPNGPGSVNPVTKAQLQQIKTAFNSILNSD